MVRFFNQIEFYYHLQTHYQPELAALANGKTLSHPFVIFSHPVYSPNTGTFFFRYFMFIKGSFLNFEESLNE